MKTRSITKIFITSIVFSSLLVLPFLLDISLLPRYLSLAVGICLLLYYLYKLKLISVIKVDLILLSYGCYVIISCLSVFWSNTKSEAIFESSKQVLAFLVFLFTYFFLKTEHDYFLKVILKSSVFIFVLAFLVVVYQLINLENLSRESLYLVSGLHGHKNLLASFLFLNLFFLIQAYYFLKDRWKIIALICAVLNLVLLFLLKTKAVWMGLLVTTIIVLVLIIYSVYSKTNQRKIKLYLLLIPALLLSNLFFFVLLQPFIHTGIHYTSQINTTGGANESSVKLEEERLILWDKTYTLIKEKPLLGVGAGNWQIHLPDATLSNLWRGEDLNYTFQRPHNDFLWILSETGIVGFNFFLLFIFTLLFALIRSLSFLHENKFIGYDIILCAAFISGYLIISFFDFPKERIEHGIWLNIIFGMSYYYIKTIRPLKEFGEIRLGKLPIRVSLIGVLFIAFIALMRLKGEFFTRKMYDGKNSNSLNDLIVSGNSALSFAYTIDPTSVPIHWYTANAKASLGNYEEAQKDFIQAYRFNPYNRNVLNDLASSYVFTNNVLLAKKYYEEAARISPRFDEPKLNLAALYINAKDFKTASLWLNSLMHDSERRKTYQKIVELSK